MADHPVADSSERISNEIERREGGDGGGPGWWGRGGRTGGRAYELDEGLVAVGADVAHGVDDPAEGLAELDELLLGALPRHVPEVEHLGRRLRVPELLPAAAADRRRHLAGRGGEGKGSRACGGRREQQKARVRVRGDQRVAA